MKKIIFVFLCSIFLALNSAFACTSNQIDTGSGCQDVKFSLTTTNLSANTTFKFFMSAAGVFYVDWGDGTVQTIDRTGDTTGNYYTHAYTTSGTKTIKFSGVATAYSTASGEFAAAIRFGYDYSWTETTTPRLVASISGSLGAMFPTLNNGSSDIAYQPRFSYTFALTTNMKQIPVTLFDGVFGCGNSMFSNTFWASGITSIPENLFADISGTAGNMFECTFQSCKDLTSIPENLFSGVSGSSGSLFYKTFEQCQSLTSIPENLFSGVSGGASYLFYRTFYGCIGLTSIPENLFSHITTGATYMFGQTFQYCVSVTSIPGDLFSTITTGGNGMFYATFYGCTGLTSLPAGLFSRITLSAYGLFAQTFQNCTSLTSIPENLFSGVTTATGNMFGYTFDGCTNLSGYIPPSAFAGLIANGSPTASDTWAYTFNGTQLATTCPSGSTQYTTGYEGSSDGSTWNGKVSCSVCPAGTYSSTTNAASCSAVSAGYFCSGGCKTATPTSNSDCLSGNTCGQCLTDSATGRYAYSGAGASSCSVCPAVTGTLASRLRHYNGWWENNIHTSIGGCYVSFDDDDPNATYSTTCFYSTRDEAYGGSQGYCQIFPDFVYACVAGKYSTISSLVEYYGVDSMKGRVCTPTDAGYYSPEGATTQTQCPAGTYSTGGVATCTACATGYNSAAGASSCTANTISVRWGNASGSVHETTTCTYDGALMTPTTTPTAPRGYHFIGWSFN